MVILELNRKYLDNNTYKQLNNCLTKIRYLVNEFEESLSVSFPEELKENYKLTTNGTSLLAGIEAQPLISYLFR